MPGAHISPASLDRSGNAEGSLSKSSTDQRLNHQLSEDYAMDLRGRNLLKVTDLTREEFLYLVDLGRHLREEKRSGQRHSRLSGRNIALIFEKPSTRTRAAFGVAAHDEGAHVTYLGPGALILAARNR